ncbi:hypothetical protein [Paenibacillus allorhizoplanae]|uniref:hypothetical protein n=1 Tax=Paenibacillus allorhizoplanae TaxID=2905648 RepID=UPI001F27E28E|nr:hypothetical protein [Paenibacillus allorhizoplanae]
MKTPDGEGVVTETGVSGKTVQLDPGILNNALGYDIGDLGVIEFVKKVGLYQKSF